MQSCMNRLQSVAKSRFAEVALSFGSLQLMQYAISFDRVLLRYIGLELKRHANTGAVSRFL